MIDSRDPRLTAYVLRELDEESCAEVEQAMAADEDVRRAVEEIRAATDWLRSEWTEADAELAPDFRQQLRHRAEQAPAVSRAEREAQLMRYWAWGGLAAAVCLCIGLVRLPQVTRQNVAGVPRQERAESRREFRRLEVENQEQNPVDQPEALFGQTSQGKFSTRAEATNLAADYPPAEEWGPLSRRRNAEYSPFDFSDADVELELRAGSEEENLAAGDLRFQREAAGGLGGDGWAGNQPGGTRLSTQLGMETEVDLEVADEFRTRSDDEGWFLGDVNVEYVEGTDVFIARGRPGDVEHVERIVGDLYDRPLAAEEPPQDAAVGGLDVVDAEPAQVGQVVDGLHDLREDVASGHRLGRDDRLRLGEQNAARETLAFSVEQDATEVGGTDGEEARAKGAEDITRRIQSKLAQQRAQLASTWRRVRAIPNTSRLMVGDREELPLKGMQMHVQVDGFRARVMLDCFYYNDQSRQLEGTFKLRLPDDASLYYFAFGQSAVALGAKGEITRQEFVGTDSTLPVSLRVSEVRRQRGESWRDVKEARMVRRERAAFAYGQTVRRRVDPALVEWAGAGVFQARVFPLVPSQLHRIVIGYDVPLRRDGADLALDLALPDQMGEAQVDIRVTAMEGMTSHLAGKSKVEVRETERFVRHLVRRPEGGDTLALRLHGVGDVFLKGANEGADEQYFASQVQLNLPRAPQAGSSRAVFLLDTSLSSQPDKFNVWLDLMEQVLQANRDSLEEFAVVWFNVESRFWKSHYVPNTPEHVRELRQDCEQLALEGATDLYGALTQVTAASWVSAGERPDVFLLSDGAANWGETNIRLLANLAQHDRLGSLFAYQTGFAGTAIAQLRALASATGGAVFSVASEAELESAAVAHRSRPWRLVGIRGDEVHDLLTAGRAQYVYPDQTLTIVGRLPAGAQVGTLLLELEQGGQRKSITVAPKVELSSELASRLYGQVAVGQLESLGETAGDVAASYARHFRITGRTCSLLMLESEEDYRRFGIEPQEDAFVIQSKDARDIVRGWLERRSEELDDPKAQLWAFVDRLQKMPGMQLELPTALGLAMEDIELAPVNRPLRCTHYRQDELPAVYRDVLRHANLDYDAVQQESQRRAGHSADDALKALSSLVERDPANLVLARDVAFSAMEQHAPAAAYHLLLRVARARPQQASIYPALGQCLLQLGDLDRAVVFYEVALGGTFPNVSRDFHRIAAVEYAHLLREMIAGQRTTQLRAYAQARLKTLTAAHAVPERADLLITMNWNTDRTDVDLHIVEPNGEECFYSHPRTRAGGQLTQDVTNGFGPEMYTMPKAVPGEYEVLVKYFRSDQNRAGMRSKVYLTIYQDFGTGEESMIRQTINVTNPGHKESVQRLRLKGRAP